MKKRDGRVLSEEDINSFVHGAAHGTWADYQLSAMLMALFLQVRKLLQCAHEPAGGFAQVCVPCSPSM